MRVLLVGNYIPDAQESMQRFAHMLRKGLIQSGAEVRLLNPPNAVGGWSPVRHWPSKWLGYVDKLLLFPRVLKREAQWADVVHICDHSNALYVRHVAQRPHLVTCHDVLALQSALGAIPENPVRWSGRRLQRMIWTGLREAQRIACVSDATTDRLIRLGGIETRRVSRVYNGPNTTYAPLPPEESYPHLEQLGVSRTAPFILHVGGNQWYKNRAGVARIFASIRKRWCESSLKLVMVGKPLPREVREIARDLGIGEALVELSGVDDKQLNALYSTAQFLLFPSFDEGFGWPIIEAQACGCPVVTAGRPPMNEVGGRGAVYIDPSDAEGAAREVIAALPFLEIVRVEGFKNVQRFSVAAMTQSYVDLYRRAINEKRQKANHSGTRRRDADRLLSRQE